MVYRLEKAFCQLPATGYLLVKLKTRLMWNRGFSLIRKEEMYHVVNIKIFLHEFVLRIDYNKET